MIVFHCKIMPFFSIWNHWYDNLIFTIWFMFWNISRIYCFLFLANCCIIILKIFPIVFLRWNIYSFSVIFICERFNFCYSLWIVFDLLMIYCGCYSVLKAFVICFIDRIVGLIVSFLFFQWGESTYDPPRFRFILWHL